MCSWTAPINYLFSQSRKGLVFKGGSAVYSLAFASAPITFRYSGSGPTSKAVRGNFDQQPELKRTLRWSKECLFNQLFKPSDPKHRIIREHELMKHNLHRYWGNTFPALFFSFWVIRCVQWYKTTHFCLTTTVLINKIKINVSLNLFTVISKNHVLCGKKAEISHTKFHLHMLRALVLYFTTSSNCG